MRVAAVVCACLACALMSGAHVESAAASAPAYSAAGYWAAADAMMAALESGWSGHRQAYLSSRGWASVRINSAMLLTHAVAAHGGHVGATRQDARARLLVDRLISSPAWMGTERGPGSLSTCWSADLERPLRQHLSLEPKVAEALAWAWRARRELGLSPTVARRLARRLDRCASSSAWRYPRVLANQINWSAEMYASAVTVSGRGTLLVRDYRRQLARFAAGIRVPMPGKRTTTRAAWR